MSIKVLLSGDRWKVEGFLRCVKKCFEPRLAVLNSTLVSVTVFGYRGEQTSATVRKGEWSIQYSATELVLGQFMPMWAIHSGIKQNAKSTGITLNWDAIFFREPHFFTTSQNFMASFSFFFVLFGVCCFSRSSSENKLVRLRVDCLRFDVYREEKHFFSASCPGVLAPIQSRIHSVIGRNFIGCKLA